MQFWSFVWFFSLYWAPHRWQTWKSGFIDLAISSETISYKIIKFVKRTETFRRTNKHLYNLLSSVSDPDPDPKHCLIWSDPDPDPDPDKEALIWIRVAPKDYSGKTSIFFKIFNFFVSFRPVSEYIIIIVYKL